MKKFFLLIALLLLTVSAVKLTPTSTTIAISHRGYISYFDTKLKYPVRVEWWETRNRVNCPETKLERLDDFRPDPEAATSTDLAKSYKGSGFDRGHMCPAADNECDPDMLSECFYFSNMAPQYHSLNAGDWKKLETLTRNTAIAHDSVLVECGSVGSAGKIGDVTIPTQCWKIIQIKKTKEIHAYLFNNTKAKPVGLDKCIASLNEIENLTGFKFSTDANGILTVK